MSKQTETIYREVQYFRQLWVWAIVLGIAIFMWYAFIQQIFFNIPAGDNPMPNIVLIIFWIIFGIGLPLAFLIWFQLTVEVRKDGLYIRFRPFHFHYKVFLFADIMHYESITYNSLTRFLGWGIRSNGTETAYNTSGDKGVIIKLKNKTIIIGTENPDLIIEACNKAKATK